MVVVLEFIDDVLQQVKAESTGRSLCKRGADIDIGSLGYVEFINIIFS